LEPNKTMAKKCGPLPTYSLYACRELQREQKLKGDLEIHTWLKAIVNVSQNCAQDKMQRIFCRLKKETHTFTA